MLACFATTKEIYTAISANHENDFANAEMPFGSKCSGHGDFIRTYLGVVKYKQHEIKPTLVASYGKPLHLTINPMSTNLEKVAAEAPYTDLSNYFGNKTNLYDLVDTDPINITDTEAAISYALDGYRAPKITSLMQLLVAEHYSKLMEIN